MGGKPRPKKYQMVLLNCGYVESSALAKVFFINQECYFPSKEEALCHLAHSLLEVYLSELDYSIGLSKSECCKKALKHSDYEYCPKCRTQLRHTYDFEDFEFWINDLPLKVANDLPDLSQYMHWWPWVSLKEITQSVDRCIEIEDSAGSVLVGFLKDEFFDKQAAQESSILHKLGSEMLKKAHAEWGKDRSPEYFKYIASKIGD